MVGKRARDKKTGELYGLILRDHGSSWYIETLAGKNIDLLKDLVELEDAPGSPAMQNDKPADNSSLIIINQIFGILCAIGGLVCLINFWPESRSLSIGYEYKAAAYIPAVATGLSGVISALVFFNFAALLRK